MVISANCNTECGDLKKKKKKKSKTRPEYLTPTEEKMAASCRQKGRRKSAHTTKETGTV